MLGSSRSRIAVLVAVVVLTAVLLPIGARAIATQYDDDSLWANSLRSLAGLQVPFDFAIFLEAGEAIRRGESPYVDPDVVISENEPAPYAYPPLLALLVMPVTFLPEKVAGSSAPAILVSLLLIACTVGALFLLGVTDWRCYPVALLYPPTLENVEYGAIGPVLALLVALGWRYRDRNLGAAAAVGLAIALKVFLWPLVVWLAATRPWRAALAVAATALGLVLVSWAVTGFRGLTDYPDLLRRLADVEAESSYSAFAVLRALGAPELAARALVVATGVVLLVLAWRTARATALATGERDRRSLTLTLAAGLVLTPILWLHYLVLLVVPIALARPRLSALWLAPLALTVFEALDWYRGWPRGDGAALATVAGVAAIVFVVSLLPRDRARRLAACL
ncbi:MAG TPA: glycosyltransferase family 87 protein [Gaiellaceae bacterium]|nr:glycosyltransferase family 87 protein [Gaiellaceae bacterium]